MHRIKKNCWFTQCQLLIFLCLEIGSKISLLLSRPVTSAQPHHSPDTCLLWNTLFALELCLYISSKLQKYCSPQSKSFINTSPRITCGFPEDYLLIWFAGFAIAVAIYFHQDNGNGSFLDLVAEIYLFEIVSQNIMFVLMWKAFQWFSVEPLQDS